MSKLLTPRNLALLGALGAVLGLWSATRTWVAVDVAPGAVQIPQVVVDGAAAAPSITAVSIVVLAGSLALLIAQKTARYVIAGISLLAGIAMIAAGVGTLNDPQAAAAAALAEATGLAQNEAVYHLSAWPAAPIIGGILIIVQALCVALRARSWPTKADKYARTAAKSAEEPKDASSRNIASWEQLSAGDDPTDAGPER